MKAMKYEIERKVPGSADYIKLAEVKGKGAILQANDYEFVDSLSGVSPGTVQYRIKQVIDTVSLTEVYLDSLTLTKDNSCNAVIPNESKTLHIYPNPVRTEMLNFRDVPLLQHRRCPVQRQRQAAITTELVEIISGAEAL